MDRAEIAVAEIAARHDAEAAEAARAAEIDPVENEDDRRDELSRWAEQDSPDLADTGRGAEVDDGPQLER